MSIFVICFIESEGPKKKKKAEILFNQNFSF